MRDENERTAEAAWRLFAATGLPEAYLLSRWSAQWEERPPSPPTTRPH